MVVLGFYTDDIPFITESFFPTLQPRVSRGRRPRFRVAQGHVSPSALGDVWQRHDATRAVGNGREEVG